MPTRSRAAKPEELVSVGESVPLPVLRAQAFLRDAGIWYRLARNSPATSCRDAAHRRERLGKRGIPLWDELKTIAVSLGPARIAFLHARGDEQIDFKAASGALGVGDLAVVGEDALAELGLGYGLVNPFESWGRETSVEVVHVFDAGLFKRLGVPGTMMTNAGDRTWAVEFYADELLEQIRGHIVASIARPEGDRPAPVLESRKVGIVTGNAPESGIALWQHTLDEVRRTMGRANRGDVSMPPMQMLSIPEMGLSMELDQRVEPVFQALAGAVEELCLDGCRLVAVACNTTQYFGDELARICEGHDAEFVSMPAVVAEWLRGEAIRSVGLVGIRFVSDLGEWSAYGPALAEFDVEIPSGYGMSRIEEIAYQVKAEGPSVKALGRLRNVLRDEMSSTHVVLALTELSVLLELDTSKRSKDDKVLVDPLRLYGESLAHRYLDGDLTN